MVVLGDRTVSYMYIVMISSDITIHCPIADGILALVTYGCYEKAHRGPLSSSNSVLHVLVFSLAYCHAILNERSFIV